MGGMMDGTGFGVGYGLVGLLFSLAIIVGVVLYYLVNKQVGMAIEETL